MGLEDEEERNFKIVLNEKLAELAALDSSN
jgi:hypothetical protein